MNKYLTVVGIYIFIAGGSYYNLYLLLLQDTLRYVENQVQTFGESVKGFCSNVLQDFLPPALSIPVNHDADTVPQEGKFVMETYQKSITNLKEKHVDSNPVIHDAESVPQKGKIVTETRKKSATNLKEKYVDTNTELLPSALSNPVNHDAESVPQKGKHATQNSDKPLIIIKEKQDLGHHRLNNAKQTMPMPTEGEEKLRKALFPLARDEFALVHDNVKSSGVGYIGSEFERLVAKEKSLSDSNSIGINDETSLVFVTEDDYFNQELTDESVSTAVDDSLRVCLSDKERTCDTFFDDCHCQTIGIPPSSEVECSFSRGCQVVEPTLMSSTSSLSNDSYYQSGFCTIPHETESFVCDLTDSVGTVSETSGTLLPHPTINVLFLLMQILSCLYVFFFE